MQSRRLAADDAAHPDRAIELLGRLDDIDAGEWRAQRRPMRSNAGRPVHENAAAERRRVERLAPVDRREQRLAHQFAQLPLGIRAVRSRTAFRPPAPRRRVATAPRRSPARRGSAPARPLRAAHSDARRSPGHGPPARGRSRRRAAAASPDRPAPTTSARTPASSTTPCSAGMKASARIASSRKRSR